MSPTVNNGVIQCEVRVNIPLNLNSSGASGLPLILKGFDFCSMRAGLVGARFSFLLSVPVSRPLETGTLRERKLLKGGIVQE